MTLLQEARSVTLPAASPVSPDVSAGIARLGESPLEAQFGVAASGIPAGELLGRLHTTPVSATEITAAEKKIDASRKYISIPVQGAGSLSSFEFATHQLGLGSSIGGTRRTSAEARDRTIDYGQVHTRR